MFDRTKLTLKTCKSAYKRWRTLGTKLIRNPFLPLLFISEFVKVLSLGFVKAGPLLSPTLFALFVLSLVSTIIWIFADELLDEVQETYNEVIEEKE